MNEILEIVTFHEIFNFKYIKHLLRSIIVKDELIQYLRQIDYRSFDEIVKKEDVNKIKMSHVINFLIDNRKNLYRIIDYEKLKNKNIKLNSIIKFHCYTKWVNIYKLIAFLAKIKS